MSSNEGELAAGGSFADASEEFMITHAPIATPSLQKLKNRQKKAGKADKAQGKKQEAPPKTERGTRADLHDGDEAPRTPKRGQHGRKKKLKEKYKDQDEEERLIKMQLLRVSPVVG